MKSDYALNIAVSCNERYVPGALVALAGVAVYSKKETALVFHVFTENVSVESIDFMRCTLKRLHANSQFIHHVCDEKLLSNLPYWAGSRMAAVRCYYAMLLPDIDWCLYLDCDVLYLASVEEHFSYVAENVYACVVQEESFKTRQKECAWIRLNCDVDIPDEKYFNSGVVLFNFKKMREDGVPERLIRFFKDHPKVPSPDQDALNVMFAGGVKLIPQKFDRLQIFLDDDKLAERPVIHYVCGNPWLPKLKCVANFRFRLWHAFADKYIYCSPGASVTKLFSWHTLALKNVNFIILSWPVIGSIFACLLQFMGFTASGTEWRNSQICHDCRNWKKVCDI